MLIVHKIASWLLKRRIEHVESFMRRPHDAQERIWKSLTDTAKNTQWGQKYGYADIKNIDDYRSRVPINDYEGLYPYIERMLKGEPNILWPGRTQWFAKSSGTTNDRSKFIPVSPESLEECHFKAGQDMLSMYFHSYPESKLFNGKSLSIGGSHTINQLNSYSRYGDLSAVILENLPAFYELMRTPSKDVALMDDWDEKIEAMASEIMFKDVTSIAGVPTWTLVLLHHILEKTGFTQDVREIWPNLELYIHGGVSFEPYREQFRQLIPHDDMVYLDCYNASEGYFAVQNEWSSNDLLLMLDYGIFYEFLPVENLEDENPKTHTLDEVQIGRNYAMVISTNAGLWRYLIGDTVTFTSTNPYKIRITGRTKHFINAFGEELVVDNAEMSLSEACRKTGASIGNYTACPIYFKGNQGGGHEWLIEFTEEPDSIDLFCEVLDSTLKTLNSDYEAKRSHDLALKAPLIRVLPKGTFHLWMKKRGKLGGQHKVPRLANHRKYVDDILNMMSLSKG